LVALMCLLAIGHLIGHLLKLDRFYDDYPKIYPEINQ
jgi:hypothetical protein